VRDQDLFLEQALLESGTVSPEQMDAARRHAAEQGVSTCEALIQTEVITGRQLALVRADVCEAPFVDLAVYETCYANTALLPRAVAERFTIFPLFMIDNVLTVALVDPLNLEAVDQVRQIAKCEVETVLAEGAQLQALISRAYSLSYGRGGTEVDVDMTPRAAQDMEADQPAVAAVNQILADAAELRCSDVHINPDERELHIRYRIDGVLRGRQGPPLAMHPALVQRLKVMANLDLTQTRRPQDGKFRFRHKNQNVDVRMSTVPTIYGENVVLRLLASAQAVHDFHKLGIPAAMVSELEDLFDQPYGMVLVTGPTGSGKTTTLYTALNRLNEPSSNLMTVEDPVEIRLPYVRQIQVHPEIGLNFATALRSLLRQDPDIILVGEIRDNETATIALQAALTGHLVLSTLHTNDAVGAVARLRDYGLPSFVINSSVLGVLAQRLVRRNCQHCLGPDAPEELLLRRFGVLEGEGGFVRGRGCARCGQCGFRGRIGLYELLRFSRPVQQLVEQGVSTDRIRDVAVAHGMRLMWQDGLEKARLGLSTLEEVARTVTVVEMAGVEPASGGAGPVTVTAPARQRRLVA
jgi:type IV pilus assembly protein PilB